MALCSVPLLVGGLLRTKALTALLGGVSSSPSRALGVSHSTSIGERKRSVGRFFHLCEQSPLKGFCSAVSREGPLKQSTMVEKTERTTVVEHVVLFNVKKEVPVEKIEKVFEALRGLKNLECVQDLSAGRVLQILGGDYTHVLHSRYLNKADLDTYSQHPEHLQIVTGLLPLVDDILALDWDAEPAGSAMDGGHGAARIALIKLADAITETQSTEVFDLLYGLKDKFPFIRQVSAGLNISPARSKGLNVGFLALFNKVEELQQLNGNRELHGILQNSTVAPFLDTFIVVDIGRE